MLAAYGNEVVQSRLFIVILLAVLPWIQKPNNNHDKDPMTSAFLTLGHSVLAAVIGHNSRVFFTSQYYYKSVSSRRDQRWLL